MVDFKKRLSRPPIPGMPAELAETSSTAEQIKEEAAEEALHPPAEEALHPVELEDVGDPAHGTPEESVGEQEVRSPILQQVTTEGAIDNSGLESPCINGSLVDLAGGSELWAHNESDAEVPAAVGEEDPLPPSGVREDPNALTLSASVFPGGMPGIHDSLLMPVADDLLTDEEEAAYTRRQDGPEGEPQWMYLAGTAGTGKSYQARQRALDYDDAILCATTGIAAVNLEGTTINSILRYYDTASLRAEYEFGRLNVALKQLAEGGCRRLIIDEISMMDGNQLDIICLAVDEVNEGLIAKHKKPMGITLVGDFAQLPPVKAPFVFEKNAWIRFEQNTIMLTEPRRQADPEFVRALQSVRRGNREAGEYFRRMITPGHSGEYDGTTIAATNLEVDRINALRMIGLKTPEHKYSAIRTGDPKAAPSEWKIIPETLILKPECLVMILANYREGGDPDLVYANGDLAHYIGPVLADNPRSDVMVKLKRNDRVVRIKRIVREKKLATGNVEAKITDAVDLNDSGARTKKNEIVAAIEYLPLRVAYGSTVHKSQGLSLDHVQLMINSKFWMSPGMLYVALSRARTPQGLKIIGTYDQFVARIRANQMIERWL